jgi:hypothetical protein
MRRRWIALAVVAFGLVVGVVARSALLAVGRLAFVVLLLAIGVGALLLLTATPAYDRSKVGVGSRVVDRPLDETTTCVACDEAIETGRRRVFVSEWVLFGVPLVLLDRGENDYCPACADEEPSR